MRLVTGRLAGLLGLVCLLALPTPLSVHATTIPGVGKGLTSPLHSPIDADGFDLTDVGELIYRSGEAAEKQAPKVVKLNAPETSGGTTTAGIQEAIDRCSGTPNDTCRIEIGPGDYTITKTCSQWLRTNASGARISGDNVVGGGAILIAEDKNIIIQGGGPTATRIEWNTDFSVSTCGLSVSNGVNASVFRLDSGNPTHETRSIVFRDLSIEAKQGVLTHPADQIVGISAVEIGATGTVDEVTFDDVYLEAANDVDDSAHNSRTLSLLQFFPSTASHMPRRIYIQNSRIECSDACIFQGSADDVHIWGSWIGSVDDAGYGCSDGLVTKVDGTFSSNGNTWEHGEEASHCVQPLRWAHLDSRGSRDFGGQWAKFIGDTFLIRSKELADKFFEGFYITGYNGATIVGNTFICSKDLMDTTTAGDGAMEGCMLRVIQIDNRNGSGGDTCAAGHPCNVGNLISNNVFWGFRDNIDSWEDGAIDHGCPININSPTSGNLNDNQYNVITDNIFRISDANGVLDTGSLANGFCGGEIPGHPDYLSKNFISNNVVIGKPTQCLAGQGLGCKVGFDISTGALSVDDLRATALLVGAKQVCLEDGTHCPTGGSGSMSSFLVHANSGTDGTVSNGQSLSIDGGTNGIDAVTTGTGNRTVALSLDPTEFPMIFTWGDGSAGLWIPTINLGMGALNPTKIYSTFGAQETFFTAWGVQADSIIFTTTQTGDAAFTVPNDSLSAAELGPDSVSASELNAPGVKSELEAILVLQNMQGTLDDSKISDTLTASKFVGSGSTSNAVDLATTEVSGDLATSHLNSGVNADTAHFWRGDGTWSTPPGTGTTTAVGPACSSGACLTDGVATTGVELFTFEGTTVNAFEYHLIMPSADPSADVSWTFPAATGLLIGTGDSATVTGTMIATDTIAATNIGPGAVGTSELLDGSVGFIDIDQSITIAANPALAANAAYFGDGGVVFEGSAADANETRLVVTNPTADRTLTLPNVTGTLVTSGDTGSVTSAMILDATIVAADLATDSVTGTQIAANSVGTSEVTDDSLTASDLAASSVGTSELAAAAVTRAKIGAAAVGASELDSTASYTVAGLIVTGTFSISCSGTGDCIVGLPANSADPAAPTSGAGVIAMSSGVMVGRENGEASASRMVRVVDLTGGTFALTSAQLRGLLSDETGTGVAVFRGSNALDATDIATDGVGSAEIAADAVGSSEIAVDAVGSSEIAAGAVGTSELASNSVDGTKIQLGSDAVGDTYYWDGTDFVRLPAGTSGQKLETRGAAAPAWSSRISTLDKLTTPFVLNGDGEGTTLTSIWSKSIAANTMGTTGILRAMCRGQWLNSGTTGGLTVQLGFGGTVIWKATTVSRTTSPGMPFTLTFEVANLGATNSQALDGDFWIYNETAATTGGGVINVAITSERAAGGLRNTAAIDTTSAQTLDFSMQLPNAEATDVVTLDYCTLELL